MVEGSNDFARAHAIFDGARALGGLERERFLDRQCGGDHALRREVEELLAWEITGEGADLFGESQIGATRKALEGVLANESGGHWLPGRVGPYRIVREVGAGGMGVVYEAEQQEPRRRIALKLVHPLLANEQRIRRLRREADVLGRLQHPGITQIFAAGDADLGRGPQPYIAMEFIEGVDVVTFATRAGYDARRKVELLARIADAVHHANERGVVHRDLKPDNVLVTADGTPKVLDFGIAHARDNSSALSTLITEEGQVLGTLAYMAPEQIGRDVGAVSHLADVYALGILAFELLTGQLPLDLTDLALPAAVRAIQFDEPPRLGELDPELAGELETIVEKALQKQPARRYASVAELAADLRRHLAHVPILARPPSRVYRAQKFVRRHRALVGGTIATILALTVGVVFSVIYGVRAANRASELAITKDELRVNLYNAEMLIASELDAFAGGVEQLGEIVERWKPRGGESDLRGWEWRYFRAAVEPRAKIMGSVRSTVSQIAWHPSEPWIVEAGVGGLSIRNEHTGAPVADPVHSPGQWFFGAAWSPEGDRLAYSYHETSAGTGGVVVLETENWTEVWTSGRNAPMGGLAWHPDGSRLICLDFDGVLRVFDASGGAAIAREGLQATTEGFAFDPAGERLAIFEYGDIHILDTRDWSTLATWPAAHDRVMSNGLCWDPQGQRIASVSVDGTLRVREVDDGSTLLEASIGLGGVSIAWSPDGGRLGTVGRDHAIRLWDAESLEELASLQGHRNPPQTIDWHADGDRITTAGEGGAIHVWDVDGKLPLLSLRHLRTGGFEGGLAWSPDGERLAARLADKTRIWRADGELVGDAEVFAEWSADGRHLAGIVDEMTWIHDVAGETTRTLTKNGAYMHALAAHPTEPRFTISDGSRLWSVSWDTGARELFADAGPAIGDVAWSADGRVVGIAGGRGLLVLDGETGRVLFEREQDGILCVACSADGRRVGAGGHQREVHLYDRANPDERVVLSGHSLTVSDLAWHPDGSRVATAGHDQTVKLWNANSGALCASFRLEAPVVAVAWSPDGARLGAVASNGLVRVWDASVLSEPHRGGGQGSNASSPGGS